MRCHTNSVTKGLRRPSRPSSAALFKTSAKNRERPWAAAGADGPAAEATDSPGPSGLRGGAAGSGRLAAGLALAGLAGLASLLFDGGAVRVAGGAPARVLALLVSLLSFAGCCEVALAWRPLLRRACSLPQARAALPLGAAACLGLAAFSGDLLAAVFGGLLLGPCLCMLLLMTAESLRAAHAGRLGDFVGLFSRCLLAAAVVRLAGLALAQTRAACAPAVLFALLCLPQWARGPEREPEGGEGRGAGAASAPGGGAARPEEGLLIGAMLVCSVIAGGVDGALAAGLALGGMPQGAREAGNALGVVAGAVLMLVARRRLPALLDGTAARAVPAGLVALLLASWFINTGDNTALALMTNILPGFAFSALCCMLAVECGEAMPSAGERLLLRSAMLYSAMVAAVGVLWQLLGDGAASSLCLISMVAYLFMAVLAAQRTPGPPGAETADGRAALAGREPGGPGRGNGSPGWALGAEAATSRAEELAEARGLSPREREVLGYLLLGHSAPAIAERMGISLNTVKTHAARVYRKLGVHTREELYAAVRDGRRQGGCGVGNGGGRG